MQRPRDDFKKLSGPPLLLEGEAGGYESCVSPVMLITTMTTAPLQKERKGESSFAILDTRKGRAGGRVACSWFCARTERERGLSPGLPGLCNKDIPKGSLSEETIEAEPAQN